MTSALDTLVRRLLAEAGDLDVLAASSTDDRRTAYLRQAATEKRDAAAHLVGGDWLRRLETDRVRSTEVH